MNQRASETSSVSLVCVGVVEDCCNGRAAPAPAPICAFDIECLFRTVALRGVPRSTSREDIRYANSSKGTSDEPSIGRTGVVPLENSAVLSKARNSSLLDSFIPFNRMSYGLIRLT